MHLIVLMGSCYGLVLNLEVLPSYFVVSVNCWHTMVANFYCIQKFPVLLDPKEGEKKGRNLPGKFFLTFY